MRRCKFGGYFLAMVLAGVVCGGTAETQEDIQRLARDGKTAEAIAMFESLPDVRQASADVLRAVAGCYWREGRFDDARTLYRLIMEQQPNLKNVTGEADRSALLARDQAEATGASVPVVAEASAPVAVKPTDQAASEPAVIDPASAVTEPVAAVSATPAELKVEKEIVLPPAGEATQALQAELDALKRIAGDLATSQDALRQQAEARIAKLAEAATAWSGQVDALRQQLADESGKSDDIKRMSQEARTQIEAQTALLGERMSALTEETASARMAYDQLKGTSDRKINDLLDAITAEKFRNEAAESELKKLATTYEERLAALQASSDERQRVVDEMRTAIEAEKQQLEEGRGREATLQAALNEVKTAQEQSLAEVKRLEKSLVDLRGQHDSVTGQLKARDAEVEQLLVQLKNSSLAVALQEIELLEKELATLTEASTSRQADLQSQIEALETKLSGGTAAVEAAVRERDAVLGQRADMESRMAEQAKELADAKELIAAAMAALARQYEAIREQVREGGVTMRLEGSSDPQAADGVVLERPTELVPLIGQLEAATVKAGEDVRQLRDLLESQRLAFDAAAQEKDREMEGLRQQTATLSKQLSDQAAAVETAKSTSATASAAEKAALLATHAEEKTALVAEHGKKNAALEAAHGKAMAAKDDAHSEALRVAKATYAERETALKSEIETLVNAAKDRERMVQSLEEELDAERASTVRVLELARETEAALSARIRALEAAFALPDTESPDEAVGASEPEELIDAKYREIIDLLPRQHKKAVALFEALPADAVLPAALLRAMGNDYREQKRYEKALRLFEQMVKQNPQDLYAERKLVMTLFDMGRYDQALERLAGPAVVLPDNK
ncbi:MAG TPA: hypothetical protein DCS43_15860 [Verrucomicrobia bacterium]|nr:hypothetical protein [Verrucomicrobiota bacterium]